MIHELKTWTGPFDAIKRDDKKFEFRPNKDRNFNVGDTLVLKEWDPNPGFYTGEEVSRMVTYVLHGPSFGIPDGFSVMSLMVINLLRDRE